MTILAIDGGLATCGYAVLDGVRVRELGVLVQPSDARAKKAPDRVRRARVQGELFAKLIARHNVCAIGAETMSFAPRGSAAGKVGIGLAWGVLVGLASAFGLPVVDVAPKQWQRAVMGDDVAVDYDQVHARITGFVETQPPGVVSQLLAIPKGQRNHAIDSIGVGLYLALRQASARATPRLENRA
ncbi:MAG: crossover junction endodeoxyribonuclease RuvC [Myxococcota bacterium]|nr:crossover junction endodeoxyribonuclease RuvC [Myxococcota bacterium]